MIDWLKWKLGVYIFDADNSTKQQHQQSFDGIAGGEVVKDAKHLVERP